MIKTIFTGVVLIGGGIFARVHYALANNLCHSGIGGIAQAISPTAHQNCSTIQTVVTLAPWAIGAGIVIIAVSVLYMLGILGTAAVAASKKAQTPTRSK
jgi:hypothetical protein